MPELSGNESKRVKKVARELLETLKREKLVLDWRKFQPSRAKVKVCIEDLLDDSLPETYTPELFQRKVDAVYQHIYDSYYGAGRSIYATVA